MEAAIYRFYTKENGERVRALQGKVFEHEGQPIFYRDLKEHHGRQWDEDGAWNLDYRVYEWLRDNNIKYVHYFWKFNGKLYTVTTRKIASWIERNKVNMRKLNGHRQLFLPKAIFTEGKRHYTPPWIKREMDINENWEKVRAMEEATADGYLSTMSRLAKIFREKYA